MPALVVRLVGSRPRLRPAHDRTDSAPLTAHTHTQQETHGPRSFSSQNLLLAGPQLTRLHNQNTRRQLECPIALPKRVLLPLRPYESI